MRILKTGFMFLLTLVLGVAVLQSGDNLAELRVPHCVGLGQNFSRVVRVDQSLTSDLQPALTGDACLVSAVVLGLSPAAGWETREGTLLDVARDGAVTDGQWADPPAFLAGNFGLLFRAWVGLLSLMTVMVAMLLIWRTYSEDE